MAAAGGKAEEAAEFYAALPVEFTLMGRHFVGLNGGPAFKVNEALSLQIPVETQDEVERLSDALSAVPDAEMDLVDGLLAHDDDVAGPRRQAMPEMGKSGCAEGR